MPGTCLRHTELPNTSRLFADYLYHFDRVRHFYHHPFMDAVALRASATAIEYPDGQRSAIVKALRRFNGDHPLLKRLATPGTVAVVTGQQVGLFSGPAYTIYKALTAARLAAELEASGIPAVPVFWLATEDHDFAEVSVSWSFDEQNTPVELKIQTPSTGGPVGPIAIESYPADELRKSLASFPYAGEVMSMVDDAYRPGATLGDAFASLLRSLLGEHSMLLLDPMDPDIRQLAAPMVRKAVEYSRDLVPALLERNRELERHGYHAQVHVDEQTSLVLLLEGGKRVALKRKGDDYFAGSRRIPMSELLDLGTALSPNALLRPVMQDMLLPTAAYIAGPAELAYMAQSHVLYEALLGRMPVVFPRSGFTLLDYRAQKLFSRYELNLTSFFDGTEGLRERLARILVPPELTGAMESSRGEIASALDHLRHTLHRFDPTLEAALSTSRRKIEHQISKIEHKIQREAVRRDDRAEADTRWLTGLIYPNNHLQERTYSILPFMAKYGLDLRDRLYDNVELGCPDHHILTL
jgi:bacillithiol biosynthesis cysteine-adding enzyme BshC